MIDSNLLKAPMSEIHIVTRSGRHKVLKVPMLLIDCPKGCTPPPSLKAKYDLQLKQGKFCPSCFNEGVVFTANKYLLTLVFKSYPYLQEAIERGTEYILKKRVST